MGHDTDNGTRSFASQFMRQTVAKVKAGGVGNTFNMGTGSIIPLVGDSPPLIG